jgi:hypothetical protein
MAAFGFRPVRLLNGTPWNGAVVRHSVLSGIGNIFIGDCVDLAGTASISSVDGAILHDLALASAGARVYGVVTGIIPTVGTPNLNITYGATGAYREVWVALADPNLVFESTCDEAIVTSALGQCYDIVATAGSTTTGVSAHVVDATGPGTTGLTWMWVGVQNSPANLAGLTSSSTTTVASTASAPTILEFVCVEPRQFPTQLGAGV